MGVLTVRTVVIVLVKVRVTITCGEGVTKQEQALLMRLGG
jgi:hypothetical protein